VNTVVIGRRENQSSKSERDAPVDERRGRRKTRRAAPAVQEAGAITRLVES
jgi:hypothetical protein